MSGFRSQKRNRRDESLDVLHLEVEHAAGVERMDPNGQIIMLVRDTEKVLGWQPVPGRVSVISGRPAILYRAEDFEIPLTVGEYVGLVGRELEPHEALRIMEEYGPAFDWHDDFYDEETGDAVQPKGLRKKFQEEASALGVDLSPAPEMPGGANGTKH